MNPGLIQLGSSIYLPCPAPSVDEYLSKYINPKDIFQYQNEIDNHALWHLPIEEPIPQREIRIGKLYWPTCASQFASLHLPVGGNVLNQIRTAYLGATGPGPIPVTITDGQGTLSVTMYMLQPRPLTYIAGYERFWLLTLVDDRYFWWWKSSVVEVESSTTWTQYFEMIETALGISMDIGTIHSEYLRPSTRFTSQYEPLPLLLDAAARSIGMRFVTRTDGTYALMNPPENLSGSGASALDSQIQAATNLIAGGDYQQSDLTQLVPYEVRVLFGKRDCTQWYRDPHSVSKTLGGLGLIQFSGVSGYTNHIKTLVGDLTANFYTNTFTPVNNSDLEAYASRLAKDWYLWNLPKYDLHYAGIKNFTLDGTIELAEWTYHKNRVSTRLSRPRLNDRADGMYRVSDEEGYLSAWLNDSRIIPDNLYCGSGSGSGSGSGAGDCECFRLSDVIDEVLRRLCVERDGSGGITAITNIFFRDGQEECVQVPDCGSGGCGTSVPTTTCTCGGAPETISTILACKFTFIAGVNAPGIDGKTFFAFCNPDFAPCLWVCNTTVDLSASGGDPQTPFGFELNLSDVMGTPVMLLTGDTSCNPANCGLAGVSCVDWQSGCTAGPNAPLGCSTDLITCSPFTADFAGFPTAGAACFQGSCNGSTSITAPSGCFRVQVSEVL